MTRMTTLFAMALAMVLGCTTEATTALQGGADTTLSGNLIPAGATQAEIEALGGRVPDYSTMGISCSGQLHPGNVVSVKQWYYDGNGLRVDGSSYQIPYHGFGTVYVDVWRDDASLPGIQFYCQDFNVSVQWTTNNQVTTDAGTNPQSTHRWGNLHGLQQLYSYLPGVNGAGCCRDTTYITVP